MLSSFLLLPSPGALAAPATGLLTHLGPGNPVRVLRSEGVTADRPQVGSFPMLRAQGRPVLPVSERISGKWRGAFTTIGVPRVVADGLLVPFSGPAPRYVIHLAPESPRWLCVDMQASRLADGQPRRGGTASPRLLAWMLVPRPPERVRLYARLARRVQLEASLEPAAQQLHLRLHGAEARPASPAPKPLTPSRDQPSLDFPGPFLREPEPPQEPQEPTPAEQPVIEEVL